LICQTTDETSRLFEKLEVRKQYSQIYFITINRVEFHIYMCVCVYIDPLL
jgi:hypothetical protein